MRDPLPIPAGRRIPLTTSGRKSAIAGEPHWLRCRPRSCNQPRVISPVTVKDYAATIQTPLPTAPRATPCSAWPPTALRPPPKHGQSALPRSSDPPPDGLVLARQHVIVDVHTEDESSQPRRTRSAARTLITSSPSAAHASRRARPTTRSTGVTQRAGDVACAAGRSDTPIGGRAAFRPL